ncbi:MAG: DUF58 domain-containing protein [Nitriliruptoraceae bacterium]
MTARGTGSAVAVAGLWLAARTLGVPQLQTAAVALLVLLIGSAIWVLVLPLRLSVERTLEPSTLPFGGTARLRLLVRNLGTTPTPTAWLEDGIPAALGSGRAHRVPVLTPHRMLDLEDTLVGRHRGRFELGPVTATVRDPFGLVQRRRTIEAPGVLTVHPEIWPLPPGATLGGASGALAVGSRRATVRGDDLADVREYVHGDDLRAVHWPSTAHRGKLMVRRSEEVIAPRATVLLDIRGSRHAGSGPRSSFEVAVAGTASIVHHLDSRGRGVTLLDRPSVHAPTPRPASAWMPVLAALDPAEVDLPGLLRQIASGTAGEGTLVAVITPPDPDELRALARAGRGAPSRLAVVLDVTTFAGGPPDPAAEHAVGGLTAAGWRATRLTADDGFATRWQDLLGRRARDAVPAQPVTP